MNEESKENYICFSGHLCIAQGTLTTVAEAAWQFTQTNPSKTTLTFSRKNGEVIDLNLSGALRDVSERYAPVPTIAKRGRPKLGVTAREITLLPQHWDWLSQQPGGASVALRRLVEAARKDSSGEQVTRERITATYKFMAAIAGDLPRFEEASRALFKRQKSQFAKHISKWPSDIRDELNHHTEELSWENI